VDQCFTEMTHFEHQIEQIGFHLEGCFSSKRNVELYSEKPIFSEATKYRVAMSAEV